VLAPSVGGDRDRTKRWVLASFVAGGSVGGAFLGSVLGVASLVLGTLGLQLGLALGVIVVASVATLSHPSPWWVPQRTCQVSGYQLGYQRMSAVSFGWGVDLGVGVRTFLVTPAFYGVVGLGLAASNPAFGLVTGVVYGLARTLTIACFSLAVRRLQTKGCEATEVGAGLAKRLRFAVALATIAVPAVAFLTQAR
jgi:hypothetical protein